MMLYYGMNPKTLTLAVGSSAPPVSKSFDTLSEALSYGGQLTRSHTIYCSRIWHDRFKSCRPRDNESRLLGFSKKAAKECQKLMPGGKFVVTVSSQNARYSMLDQRSIETPIKDGYQLACWYDRYLPYAYAMLNAEDGFKAFGLDYQSVNSYFGTCMGFWDIGCNLNGVIIQSDQELYDRLYQASCNLWSSSLPFDEVWRPAICFVATQRPDLIAKRYKGRNDEWGQTIHAKILAIFEQANVAPEAFLNVWSK